MPRWFLLDHGPSDGSWNMACDEYLFLERNRIGSPVLRLYWFDPPAITIGYHQDPGRVLDLDSIRRSGVDIARRITGGRALLHKGEVTYSVVGSDSDFSGAATLVGAFERISRALARALSVLGIKAAVYREGVRGAASPAGTGVGAFEAEGADGAGGVASTKELQNGGPVENEAAYRVTSPCIASTTRFELNVAGKKVAGSAQRRSGGGFIQHGSIFLYRGSEEIEHYLKGKWSGLSDHMTTVSDEVSFGVERKRMVDLLIQGFREEFDLDFEPLELSADELGEIGKLAREKRKEFEYLRVG